MVAQPSPQHLLIIGIDGLSVTGLDKAHTPNFDFLKQNGCYLNHVQAVLPTVSAPNWMSLIGGAPPEKHGVWSNSWKPKDHEGKIPCSEVYGSSWPTLFEVVKNDASSSFSVGVFHHWPAFQRLLDRNAAYIHYVAPPSCFAAKNAVWHSILHKNSLSFAHLDLVDHAGHKYGHMSKEYLQSIEKADEILGKILGLLQKYAEEGSYNIIIVSDHGGVGHGHGGETPEERTVPCLIYGSAFAKGKVISLAYNNYDIPSSILDFLNIPQPQCWTGQSFLKDIVK